MYFNLKLVILALLVSLFQIINSFQIFEFEHYSTQIPHPSKAYRGGEDAFFAHEQLLIVADGVGGWNNYGIDPSKFSRFLCSKGAQLYFSNQNHYKENIVQIISQSSNLNPNLGSSTMAVISLDQDMLKTCYIGDSGFIIFRFNQINQQYQLIYQFKEQQHQFNFPFQLTRKGHGGDDPYQSICEDFIVKENDIVMVGSDGLFDNVFVSQILQLINKNLYQNLGFSSIPQKLAQLAIKRGKNHSFKSPFAQRAQQHKLKFQGGKLDDTTVILGLIKKKIIKHQNQFISKPIKKTKNRKKKKMSEFHLDEKVTEIKKYSQQKSSYQI